MFIYTVNPGDSLYFISQKYDVPIETIRLVNDLAVTNIVPGQALLIDTDIYTVQPGDSYYAIAQRAYVTVAMLIAANPGVNPNAIQPGMKINLPELPDYNASTFNYFYVSGTQADQALIRDFAPYTTYYSFFEYHFNTDGSLSELNDLEAIEAAWESRSAPLITITNLTDAGFSGELASQTLNNASSRQNLINNIMNLVSENRYAGVNIDFEAILPEDRDIFSTFLRELGNRLHNEGLLLTVAVPPITSEDIPWYEGYDYEAIGSVADLVFLMAYNWHYSASEPGPIAPINEVRNTIEFALEKMDSSKVILGIPLYGYNWKLPYVQGNLASSISNQNAINLAMNYNASINYSKADESPYFQYVDETGQGHVVWFEDTRSVAAKMELIREYKLAGIGAWQLGLDFPQGPWLLTNFFNIRKVT